MKLRSSMWSKGSEPRTNANGREGDWVKEAENGLTPAQ